MFSLGLEDSRNSVLSYVLIDSRGEWLASSRRVVSCDDLGRVVPEELVSISQRMPEDHWETSYRRCLLEGHELLVPF